MNEVIGYLSPEGVLINKQDITEKILRWIVKRINEYLLIPPLPAVLFHEKGYIRIVEKEENMTLDTDELFNYFMYYDPYFMTKYIVFRDLVSRGYILVDKSNKEILLLEGWRLDKPKEKLRFILLEEGGSINIKKLYETINKEDDKWRYIIACIERRGSVTYYDVASW